jgi:hypothetical protein
MKISEEEEELIRERVGQYSFKLGGLAEDLIDHLYCYLYEEGQDDDDFAEQLEIAISILAPDGLGEIENETFYLLNLKRMITMKRFMFGLGLLSAMALSTGVGFKLFEWPGANVLMGAGSLALLLVFLPLWAFDKNKYKMNKKPLERWRLILGISSSVLVGLSILFKIFHLMGAEQLFFLGALFFVVGFLPLFFFNSYKKSIEA